MNNKQTLQKGLLVSVRVLPGYFGLLHQSDENIRWAFLGRRVTFYEITLRNCRGLAELTSDRLTEKTSKRTQKKKKKTQIDEYCQGHLAEVQIYLLSLSALQF